MPEVVMPRLGWTMEVGRVVEWLKKDGDQVEVGDLILAIESDKAVNEVEAFDSGILRIPADQQIGVELPVGAPLGFIVQPGDPDPFENSTVRKSVPTEAELRPGLKPQADTTSLSEAGVATASVTATSNGSVPTISPRARRMAVAAGLDWSVLVGSGSSGRIREVDIRTALAAIPVGEPTRAGPSVRRLAEESGVDLKSVPPGRPDGRITRSDVRGIAQITLRPDYPSLGPIRRVIAERMSESARTVAPVTLTTDVDATEMVRARSLFKDELASSDDPVPSYNDIVLRLVALTLIEHPDLNASLTQQGIVQHDHVHIGLAVDAGRGLLVPVVRDVDRKSVHAIARDARDLIRATLDGSISGDQLRGGTFTVTNLGAYGIDAFTPIINLPECAVLGLGRIRAQAVVVDDDTGEIAARKMMALSLTFDHRVVDGAPAAKFLQNVAKKIERPFSWLTR